tara:strand:- start:766 stop:1071 length:306 start_codon:yes stop_codon:yes gene_type:complete
MSNQVTLKFELDDIDGLYHTSTRSFYFEQIDRFENMKDLPVPFTKDKGNYMYWMDGSASVLLFTKILNGFGHKTAVINDLVKEEVNEYVVLTDYAGSWSQF